MNRYTAVVLTCVVGALLLTGCRSKDTLQPAADTMIQTEAIQPTEPVEKTESIEKTETVEQTESVENAETVEQTESAQQTGKVEETQAPTVQQVTEETKPAISAKGVLIHTKYGDLYYQEQWEEFMFVETVDNGTYIIVAFEAEVESVRYPLFHLTIGQIEGDSIGQITDEQGNKHDVAVFMEEVDGLHNLTEGEQNRLFAMQEEINYLIENLE